MNGKIKDYVDLLEQYKALCADLMLREKDKREALLHSDLKKIEAVLQQQQAGVMKLNNFEQRRMALQSELGFADMTAEEMLKALETDDSEAAKHLRLVYKELKGTVVQIKELNRISIEFAKKNLKFIELMSQPEDGSGSDGVYGAQGSKEARSGRSLEKMI